MDKKHKEHLAKKIMEIVGIIIDDCGKKFTDYEEIYLTPLEYSVISEHCEGIVSAIDIIIKNRKE